LGYSLANGSFFDTITLTGVKDASTQAQREKGQGGAEKRGINFRYDGDREHRLR
jgi:hypothetical protein